MTTNTNTNTNTKNNTKSTTHDGNAAPQKWDRWRTNPYTVLPHVSPESRSIAENYQLKPTDVVVLTFPKTGTTWTQTVCEQLRTNAEGYDGFSDITERQPWLEFAHDCGQDLDEIGTGTSTNTDGRAPPPPRIFKSHQLLSAINPGGKYLCVVRDPAATLLSWFDFQKAKGRPGFVEYEDANEYIAQRPELFGGKNIFGTNLWGMYEEIWSARNDPSVKTIVYEALVADEHNQYLDHLPVIADFLGLRDNNGNNRNDNGTISDDEKALYRRVAALVSREEMLRHADRFQDNFIAAMGEKYGRAIRVMEPASKVRGLAGGHRSTELNEATLQWLADKWRDAMTPATGHATYDEFAADLSDLFFRDVVVERKRPNQSTGKDKDTDADADADNDNDSDHVTATNNGNGESERRHPTSFQGGEADTLRAPTTQRRKSSIVMRRKSSLLVQQMPGIRLRRESLAPFD